MLSQAANLLNFALIKKRETVYHIVYHIVYQKRENCVSKNEGMFFFINNDEFGRALSGSAAVYPEQMGTPGQ